MKLLFGQKVGIVGRESIMIIQSSLSFYSPEEYITQPINHEYLLFLGSQMAVSSGLRDTQI